jgi:transcription elongation factor GreA
MLDAIKQKLADEVGRLNHELSVTIPDTLKRALANGDLRENGDYHAALERQAFVQARLSHLRSRLAKLSQVDLTKIPTDRVGLGSRVVVQDAATKAKETYALVVPDAMEFDGEQISVASPLGKGLLGKQVGDVAVVQLPGGVRKLKVLELRTFYDQDLEEEGTA